MFYLGLSMFPPNPREAGGGETFGLQITRGIDNVELSSLQHM